jgi:hypothetical protein
MENVLVAGSYFLTAGIASFFTGWFAVESRVPLVIALLCAPLVGMALVPSVAIEVYFLLTDGRFGAGATFLFVGFVSLVLIFPWVLLIGPILSASICCIGYFFRSDLFPMDAASRETARRILRQRQNMFDVSSIGSTRRNRKS